MEAMLQEPMLTADQRAIYDSLILLNYSHDAALALIEEHCQDIPETIERFAVTDMSSANWVLKQMARAAKRAADVDAMVEDEVSAIRKRGERLKSGAVNALRFFEMRYGPELATFAKGQLVGQKSKSIKLLHGQMGFRKSADKVIVEDDCDSAVLEIAEKCGFPDVIRIKREVSKTGLKSALESDPESFADVAHIEKGEDTFYLKPELPEAL